MVELEDIAAIKDYLKKLQKVIDYDATFSFLGIKLVKRSRLDDVLCCIYAKLPGSYKKMLKTKVDVKRYNSVLCYSLITKLLSKKFFLDPNLCVVRVSEIAKLIQSVLSTIERDIKSIEQMFSEHN